MPENYIICKINGNVFINIFSMISRIICCCLILFSEFDITYKYVIYITMTSLCFICFLLYIRTGQKLRLAILQEKNNDIIAKVIVSFCFLLPSTIYIVEVTKKEKNERILVYEDKFA